MAKSNPTPTPKPQEATVAFSTRLSPEVASTLDYVAVNTGQSRRAIVDKALRKHLKIPAAAK